MSDDYKIYVDAGRPATLNNGAGALNVHAHEKVCPSQATDWATSSQ